MCVLMHESADHLNYRDTAADLEERCHSGGETVLRGPFGAFVLTGNASPPVCAHADVVAATDSSGVAARLALAHDVTDLPPHADPTTAGLELVSQGPTLDVDWPIDIDGLVTSMEAPAPLDQIATMAMESQSLPPAESQLDHEISNLMLAPSHTVFGPDVSQYTIDASWLNTSPWFGSVTDDVSTNPTSWLFPQHLPVQEIEQEHDTEDPPNLVPKFYRSLCKIDDSSPETSFLMNHFINTFVRVGPLCLGGNSPWHRLQLPEVQKTLGKIALRTKPSNASLSVLSALLAASAFHLDRMATSESDMGFYQGIGEKYQCEAISRLQLSLKHENSGSKAKHKTILMALLTLVTVCVSILQL